MMLLLVSLVVLFSGLGVWQLQRLAWKQALIAVVDDRVHADPVPVPDSADWAGLNVAELVYQRVWLTGHFDHSAEVQSLAVSELGSGYWVMTPLLLDEGGTVLVNRGFVPQALRDPAERPTAPPAGSVRVTGLLRANEPEGGFLRKNDPVAGRWYSRDVEAIARSRQLAAPVAPFFVDAGRGDANLPADGAVSGIQKNAAAAVDEFPRGGLTVITFRNTHLVYAITWFTLAVLCVVGVVLLLKEWRRDKASLLSE